MRFPWRDRRELARIEAALTQREPALAASFATFARLTAGQRIPVIERLRPRWGKVAVTVLLPLMLIGGLAALSFGSGPSAPHVHCGAAPTMCIRPWLGEFAAEHQPAGHPAAGHPAAPHQAGSHPAGTHQTSGQQPTAPPAATQSSGQRVSPGSGTQK
jgi:hypothetical protein